MTGALRARTEAAPLVTFRLGQRQYATPLCAVREVLRLRALLDLPGMPAPLAGVLHVRGTALPVLDLRSGGGPAGDVLVLEDAAGAVGVAVDEVRAVVAAGELLPADGEPAPAASGTDSVERGDPTAPAAGTAPAGERPFLPGYVTAVLRGRHDDLVFLVDLRRMAAAGPFRLAPGGGQT